VEEVFGGLADLPVAVGQRGLQPGLDFLALEVREREHRAPADPRLVVARGEDRREGRFDALRAERRDRGLPQKRIVVRRRDLFERLTG
jgi:hypothetical protein